MPSVIRLKSHVAARGASPISAAASSRSLWMSAGSGIWISRTSTVMAKAKMPSLSALTRPSSLPAMAL
jgi:hypothetical protein